MKTKSRGGPTASADAARHHLGTAGTLSANGSRSAGDRQAAEAVKVHAKAASSTLAEAALPPHESGLRASDLIRAIARLPEDGSDPRGNALIDRFVEEFVLSDPWSLDRWVSPFGLGASAKHMRRQARYTERQWRLGTLASEVRAADGNPSRDLELRECLSATRRLAATSHAFDRHEIELLVHRRRSRLLGRNKAGTISSLALDACAFGQHARERVFEVAGDWTETADKAAMRVAQRCRNAFYDEEMTEPRLPASASVPDEMQSVDPTSDHTVAASGSEASSEVLAADRSASEEQALFPPETLHHALSNLHRMGIAMDPAELDAFAGRVVPDEERQALSQAGVIASPS